MSTGTFSLSLSVLSKHPITSCPFAKALDRIKVPIFPFPITAIRIIPAPVKHAVTSLNSWNPSHTMVNGSRQLAFPSSS